MRLRYKKTHVHVLYMLACLVHCFISKVMAHLWFIAHCMWAAFLMQGVWLKVYTKHVNVIARFIVAKVPIVGVRSIGTSQMGKWEGKI